MRFSAVLSMLTLISSPVWGDSPSSISDSQEISCMDAHDLADSSPYVSSYGISKVIDSSEHRLMTQSNPQGGPSESVLCGIIDKQTLVCRQDRSYPLDKPTSVYMNSLVVYLDQVANAQDQTGAVKPYIKAELFEVSLTVDGQGKWTETTQQTPLYCSPVSSK